MKSNTLGLTGYELEVYRSLLIAGTVSAKELSLGCSVPLTAIYPNLTILEEKGLLKKYSGDITKFQAIKPSLALQNLVNKSIVDLESAKDDLLEELESLPLPQTQQNSPIDLSMGTAASISLIDDFIAKSKKTFYVMGWRFGTRKTIFKLVHQLADLKARSIDIKLIVIAKNERTTFLSAECKKLGIPLRFLDMHNFSLVIRDGCECKITLKNISLKERVNLRITDVDLVHGMEEYFLSSWEKAKDL